MPTVELPWTIRSKRSDNNVGNFPYLKMTDNFLHWKLGDWYLPTRKPTSRVWHYKQNHSYNIMAKLSDNFPQNQIALTYENIHIKY